MSVTIKSGISSDVQTVGSVSKAAYVEPRDNAGNPLFIGHRKGLASTQQALIVAGKNDDSALMLRCDRKGTLLTGNYNPELLDNFEGATVNVQKWTQASTTFVPAQTTVGGYNFNSSNLLTANAVSILQSQRLFYKHPRIPLQMKTRVRANIGTNSNADLGFGIPTTTTMLVPNGIAVRVVNGQWYAVLTFNNAELSTPTPLLLADGVTILSTANTNAEFYVVDIVVDDDNAIVTVQNTQTGELVATAEVPVPLSALTMWGATALPVYARVWNSGAASVAPVLTLGYVQVLSTDWNPNPDIAQLAGSLGLSAGRHPFTGAQNENHVNSTAPVSAALSNTVAGYTTLGGRFQFAAPVGAITDFALFGFTIPAGSRFLCEGFTINSYNTGAAVATTPTVLEWAAGFNSSAVSLVTPNIVRRQLGVQAFQVGAAIGQQANTIDVNFLTPEAIESGRFLHVILNVPIGTATASQVIRGQVLVKGRFI